MTEGVYDLTTGKPVEMFEVDGETLDAMREIDALLTEDGK